MPIATRIAVVGSTLAAAASVLVPAAPAVQAAGPPPAGTSCTERNHVPAYKSGPYQVGISIFQMRVRPFGPGTSETVTQKVATRKVLTARALVGGEVNTKIGNKFIGQAEVSLKAEFEASGETSRDEERTVTSSVVNNTNRNIEYVFFRGAQTVTSGVLRSYCDIEGTNQFGKVAYRKVGTWSTFGFAVEGAPACGRGASNSVVREALKVGCA